MHLSSEGHLAKPDGQFAYIFLLQKYSCQIAKDTQKKNPNTHILNLLREIKKKKKNTETPLTVTLYLNAKRKKYFSEHKGQRNRNYKATCQGNERFT